MAAGADKMDKDVLKSAHYSRGQFKRYATPVSYTHLTLPTICSV